MKTLKDRVKEWIDNGCNYDEGLLILTRNSNQRSLIKNLGRGEITDDKREYLLYNLTKLADVKVEDPFTLKLPKPIILADDESNPTLIKEKNYPPEVIELKKEKAKLYNSRAIEHKKFDKIGTSNDQQSCLKRKEVKEKIEEITSQFTEADNKIQAIFDAIRESNKDAQKSEGNNEVSGTPPKIDDNKGQGSENKITAEKAIKLKQELSNSVAYISKNKDSQKENIIKKVEERRVRAEEIKKILEDIK